MSVTIVGGMSTARRVSIMSDEFVATARLHKDRRITHRVKPHPRLSRFLYKHTNLPLPQLVRLALFFVDSLTPAGKLFFCGWAFGMTVSAWLYEPVAYPGYVYVVALGILCAGLIYIRRCVASLHGAEHMAIAAYERTGSTAIRTLERESPVHAKCGGRLSVIIVAATCGAKLIGLYVDVHELLVLLVLVECMLWADKTSWWGTVSGITRASYLLQRFVTTRYPGEAELRTAHRALQALVVAHRSG